MNSSITGAGKACGKFILMGEHFIVTADTDAIAFPLHELWCEVTMKPSSVLKFEAHYIGLKNYNENPDYIRSFMNRATIAAADALRMHISSQPLHVQSRTNFPVSRGFGSSAAFSIALSRAMLDFRTQIDEKWELTDPSREIEKAANQIERLFHGKASGIDIAVILNEKPIYFSKSKEDMNQNTVQTLTNHAVDFVLVDSGFRDRCAKVVEEVSRIRADQKDRWSKFSNDTTQAVKACAKSLSDPNGAGVIAEAVENSQRILGEIGLSTTMIDETISKAKMFGALAGKVSGAGGGGAVVLVTRPGESDSIATKLRDSGCSVIATSRAWGETK